MRPSQLGRSRGPCGVRQRGLGGFVADRRAAIAPVVAVFMPVAMGVAGLAIDVSNSYVEQNRLQTAVDEASLVAVQKLPDIEAARAALRQAFAKQYHGGPPHEDDEEVIEPTAVAFGHWDPVTREVTATESEGAPPDTVSIVVERLAANGQGMNTWFLAALGIKQLDLRARAVARAEGSDVGTCIIALEPSAGEALSLRGTTDIEAPDCRIQVKSEDDHAIDARGVSSITAGEICVAGGVSTRGPVKLQPWPETGCDEISDPLADFIPPSVGTCSHFDTVILGPGSTTLQPGVYCGGLRMKPGGGKSGMLTVTMAPGTYVIKDGPFEAGNDADNKGKIEIDADHVALHLVGADARIDIEGPVELNLRAPKTGPLAGIAIYQNPNVPNGLTSRMGQGNSKTRIEGVIYLPDQLLWWAGTPTTTLPPWTLLVARKIWMRGTGQLHIESRFDESEVPVPGEFKEKKKARLVN